MTGSGPSRYRPGMDPRDLDLCVTGCAGAHQRLLADLDARLESETLDTGAASLLPSWTVGHVLGHLVGNARAFTRVVEAATRGDVGEMYPGGREARNGDIDTWAARPAHELVAEVRRSIWALETAWAGCPADGWRGVGQGLAAQIPVAAVPLGRWREVEVHRSDLGWGYEATQWDPQFVARDLPGHTTRWLDAHPDHHGNLPQAAQALEAGQRLAWLLGRYRTPDLPEGLTL